MSSEKNNNLSDMKTLVYLSWISDKIVRLNQLIERIPGKAPECIATGLYAVFHMLVAMVHEPWYDEAVAWQIARCAPLSKILFEIPHYEGHPPLWHIILMPFAKTGAPYELSLSLISLVFAGTAIGLIIWKSPFPRIIRLFLPFTYFFFFQYGVITRPYCVMMLTFVLLAMCYRHRNTYPGRYTLLLALLCLTSGYGIVFAGGLAIVWVLEIWNGKKIGEFIKSFISDKRIWWLAGLLVCAIWLIVTILPKEDTYAMSLTLYKEELNNLFVRLIYMLFVNIPDVAITNVFMNYDYLKYSPMIYSSLFFVSILGILVFVVIAGYGRKKKTVGLFFIPFILFALFASLVYFYTHHTGIVALFLVFWTWVSLREPCHKDGTKQKYWKPIMDISIIVGAVAMIISLGWTVSAVSVDIQKDYAIGAGVAKFIEENNLDDYNIMCGWQVEYDENNNIILENTYYYDFADEVAPYFEHNIFYNVMGGKDSLNYSNHIVASPEENLKNYAQWKEKGYPDVLFMDPNMGLIWGEDDEKMPGYRLVYSDISYRVWKTDTSHFSATIYVRTDLAEELGIEEVEPKNALLVD